MKIQKISLFILCFLLGYTSSFALTVSVNKLEVPLFSENKTLLAKKAYMGQSFEIKEETNTFFLIELQNQLYRIRKTDTLSYHDVFSTEKLNSLLGTKFFKIKNKNFFSLYYDKYLYLIQKNSMKITSRIETGDINDFLEGNTGEKFLLYGIEKDNKNHIYHHFALLNTKKESISYLTTLEGESFSFLEADFSLHDNYLFIKGTYQNSPYTFIYSTNNNTPLIASLSQIKDVIPYADEELLVFSKTKIWRINISDLFDQYNVSNFGEKIIYQNPGDIQSYDLINDNLYIEDRNSHIIQFNLDSKIKKITAFRSSMISKNERFNYFYLKGLHYLYDSDKKGYAKPFFGTSRNILFQGFLNNSILYEEKVEALNKLQLQKIDTDEIYTYILVEEPGIIGDKGDLLELLELDDNLLLLSESPNKAEHIYLFSDMLLEFNQ